MQITTDDHKKQFKKWPPPQILALDPRLTPSRVVRVLFDSPPPIAGPRLSGDRPIGELKPNLT